MVWSSRVGGPSVRAIKPPTPMEATPSASNSSLPRPRILPLPYPSPLLLCWCYQAQLYSFYGRPSACDTRPVTRDQAERQAGEKKKKKGIRRTCARRVRRWPWRSDGWAGKMGERAIREGRTCKEGGALLLLFISNNPP
ncbi:hypothetical protein GQ53DRAFT_497443 [Thozetella sp. PMI_491]|nr:hypothetical protein GQ53DRAFT_273088 [Thozetella sp. PMI_491]KAH8896982.1 hypothetical protein GQ53DRAFT_497443 [Thozetella sp. PMI_491]